ncbi:zinc-binding dehydrogenase [Actinosynnema pretiosum]|uniref:zinc-binding dehydrogenase n=1 Tax=Actinosynnema pretiosum TaxID=42197 RepID=UPI003CD08198
MTEFGGPEVLRVEQVDDPVPGGGQVLVEVVWAAVTFVETQARAGNAPWPVRVPYVPGGGVAGVVTAVGDGVSGELLGRVVAASTGGSGGYAERVVVDAAEAVVVPEGVGVDEAAALVADGRTAVLNLRAAGLVVGPAAGRGDLAESGAGVGAQPRGGGAAADAAEGGGRVPDSVKRVLVLAAAGGVGSLLVQLATAAGAEVVGAAGGTRKVGLVRDLGAARAVDYSITGWEGLVGEVDVVFDGVGGPLGRTAHGLLRSGGRMVSYGLASGEWSAVDPVDAARRGVELVRPERPTPDRIRAAFREALRHAETGTLKPVVGQRFPLERAPEAHAAIEARHTVGKTLLRVN